MSEKDVYRNFDRGIEEIVSWSRSWLPDASAVATLVKQYNHIFGTPESPETRREHGLFWQGVCNVVDKTQELARAECGLLDEQKLALLCLGSNEIDFWINKPSWKLIQGSIPGLLVMGEEEAKATLWTQHMVLQGIHRHQNPLAFLFPSHLVIWSGLYARRQFQQTKQKYPLSHSEALAYFSWPNDAQPLWNTAKEMGRSANRMIPKSIRPQGELNPLVCLSIELLLKDFDKYSPVEILERTLGGRFDYIPKAVFHDVIDSEKTRRAKFERGFVRASDMVRESDDGEEEESWFENLPDPSGQSPEDYLAQKGSEEFLASHLEDFSKPYPSEGWLLKSKLLEGKSYADIAHEEKKLSGRKKKLTKGRISQLMTKAAKEFARWYSSQD